ncbi:hypothetical protein KY389_03140 [Paracoccus bogoriensis]|uniref:hypothetical protein n=1 Tax=Paracoccus bogoriensis TaxID=242065 RepID=UPI001CA5D883|nr:hypothetical protein [Paracoccus bogoriensis]MBW7055689.1 hypothetical protein [Paracoccus bogoriensis]
MRLALILTILALPALASSPSAWDEMRDRLAAGCEALLPEGAEAGIEVNPFGSESYALALVTLTDPHGATERMACIMDKATGAIELTARFDETP